MQRDRLLSVKRVEIDLFGHQASPKARRTNATPKNPPRPSPKPFFVVFQHCQTSNLKQIVFESSILESVLDERDFPQPQYPEERSWSRRNRPRP
jgi:hypothetical protein